MRRPEPLGQRLKHHGGGNNDLQERDSQQTVHAGAEWVRGLIPPAADDNAQERHSTKEEEREDPVGPVDSAERDVGWQQPTTLAEGEPGADPTGVQVCNVGTEQDYQEAERGSCEDQGMPAVAAGWLVGWSAGRLVACPARRLDGLAARRPGGWAARRLGGAQGGYLQGGQEQHGVGEVGNDNASRQLELDGHGTQQDLNYQQRQRQQGGAEQPGFASVPPPCLPRYRHDQDAEERGDPAVAYFDGGGEVEGRKPLAVAAGPVISAAHAGAGDADNAAEGYQRDGEAGGGPRQPTKCAGIAAGWGIHGGKNEPAPSLVKLEVKSLLLPDSAA